MIFRSRTAQFVIFLLFVFTSFLASASTISDLTQATELNWQLEKQTSQYVIYARPIKDSDFLQTKAVITFNNSFNAVKAQFREQGCWRWNLRCSESKMITSELEELGEYLYVSIDMPWPMSDRDFTFVIARQESLNEKAGLSSFRLALTPIEGTKETKDHVRGRSHASYFLEANSKISSKLTIIMHTDFGGSASAGILNNKLVNELEKDIKALIQLVKNN